MLYDLLSGRLGVGKHRHISLKQARKPAPCLKMDKLNSVFVLRRSN